MLPTPPITRLAPSPTGHLHLGNAWSFLICWLAARAGNGRIYLRMDDIDPARSKAPYADAIRYDLEWLGLDNDAWEGKDIIWQSRRYDAYESALGKLDSAGLIYPCFCSRKEIRFMAGAPHPGDEGAPYSGKCANLSEAERMLYSGRRSSMRFRTPKEPVEFIDIIQGNQKFIKTGWGGDFALRRSDGVWAYQLASVVDDIEMGVNLVVRGRDILASTPRQIMLCEKLGGNPSAYAHLPLLLASDGERLAKRHQSLSILSLREQGVQSTQIIGLLAWLGGLIPKFEPVSARDLLPEFNLELIAPNDIFLPEQLF